jgi:hypothetical protein
MFVVFLITALVCFCISIAGLNNGLNLVPTAGMLLFGMVFIGLAFSSKDIAKLCHE